MKPVGDAQEWLVHAESDLEIVRLVQERRDVLATQACFHAQQAVEKSIKAMLLNAGVDFPFTHDLQVLLEIAEQHTSVPDELGAVAQLNPYAVLMRYPMARPEQVMREEVDEATRLAEIAVEWARQAIS